MSRPPRRALRRAGDGGYILVAVLGVMLVLTGFMAAGSLLVRSALDTVRVGDTDVAASGIARAGLELTAYELFVLEAAPAAVDGRRLRVAGGSFVAHLVDEGGKADLDGSDSKLLGSVFKSAGLGDDAARELIACIVGLRGPDKTDAAAQAQPGAPQTRPPDASAAGAPDLAAAAQQQVSAGQAPTPPGADRPKLRGFQSVDQLRDCPDLTGEDYAAIAPMLTVYNPDGKVDIMTASPAMLHALPGLSEADVEVILSRRAGAVDKKAADDLMALMKEAQAYGKIESGPAYTVRIDAVSATGRKKTLHAVIASSKSRAEPFYVLDRWD